MFQQYNILVLLWNFGNFMKLIYALLYTSAFYNLNIIFLPNIAILFYKGHIYFSMKSYKYFIIWS